MLTIERIRELATDQPGHMGLDELRELLDAAACLAVMEQHSLEVFKSPKVQWFARVPRWLDGQFAVGTGDTNVDAVRDWCKRNGVEWPTRETT